MTKTPNFFEDKYAEVDKTLMEDGAPVDFGSGFIVDIRHVSSLAVTNARTKITQQLKVMGRNKELTPEQNQQVLKYVCAHGGIAGWHGGGVPEFTPAYALEVFEKRPEFLEDIVTAMTTYETFRKEQIDEAVEALGKSSTGD